MIPADEARREAERILAEDRFGHRDEGGVGDALGDLIGHLRDGLQGVHLSLSLGDLPALILIALVGAAIVLVTSRAIAAGVQARRAASAPSAPHRLVHAAPLDPAELERRAEQAERSDDSRLAVRLRFQALLLRLGARGAIRLRPSLTPRMAASEAGSARLAGLASTFEAVVYGGRDADAGAVASLRSAWRDVSEELDGR